MGIRQLEFNPEGCKTIYCMETVFQQQFTFPLLQNPTWTVISNNVKLNDEDENGTHSVHYTSSFNKMSQENLNVYSRGLKHMMSITWVNHICRLMSVKKLPKH